jgi:hypothetical protein
MALIDVVNALFRKSNKWSEISDEEKSLNFFIINRYMSKKYTKQSQLLNLKSIDKVLAMELWFHFMQKQPYPSWFWSKSNTLDKPEIPNKDYKLLLSKLNIKPDDLNYLINKHYDFIKEELLYYKKIEKGN